MLRAGRGLRLGVLALALAVTGCAGTPERRPPVVAGVPLAEVDGLLQRWEAQWQEFRGLRAAVDVTVVRKGVAQRSAGGLILSPTHLRIEAISPVGLPIVVITLGPDRLLVLSLAERRAWSGAPTPEAVSRWIGVPLPRDALIRLLAGYAPAPPAGVVPTTGQDRGSHLVFQEGRFTERIWVTPGGQPARVELDDGRRITTTFDRAVTGQLQGLTVDAPGQSAAIYVRFVSGEYFDPPAGAFEITVPPDIQVERLD